MRSQSNIEYDFDFIVIGSGFGGSVAAHRLTEKGYQVGVLEMGKRYETKDFPKTNWNLRKFLWWPQLGMKGIFRMSPFRHTLVLSGVGVGGGSLVYANTLLVPPEQIWDDKKWVHLKAWRQVMPPFYETSEKMLGVTTNPVLGTADKLLRDTANRVGRGDTFYPTEVGIFFGEPGKTVPDPYFDGAGPERTGCTFCGGCMVGCRVGAKNTLDKNYLYLAEKNGATVLAETKVIDVRPIDGVVDGSKGYEVHALRPGRWPWQKEKIVLRTRGLVFAAGVIGTVKLLLSAKASGSLPLLSDQVGEFVRTNSESIIGVHMNDKTLNLSEGIAIGSGVHIDEHTHIEAVRYSPGSDLVGVFSTPLTNGTPGLWRIFSWLRVILSRPSIFLKSLNFLGFAKSSLILLVMQPIDTRITMRLKRAWWWPFSKTLTTEGERIPTYIPQANRFAEQMGQEFDGIPMTALSEIFLDIPTTAHILGGAAMGANINEGVIDNENRVFNYKNMYVCDGSMIGANLGVNPSLTITALAEHAMSHIKPKTETQWNDIGRPLTERSASPVTEQATDVSDPVAQKVTS